MFLGLMVLIFYAFRFQPSDPAPHLKLKPVFPKKGLNVLKTFCKEKIDSSIFQRFNIYGALQLCSWALWFLFFWPSGFGLPVLAFQP